MVLWAPWGWKVSEDSLAEHLSNRQTSLRIHPVELSTKIVNVGGATNGGHGAESAVRIMARVVGPGRDFFICEL